LIASATSDAQSPLHGVNPATVTVRDGELTSSAARAKTDSFAALVERSGQPEIRVQVTTKEKEERKQFSLHSFGAQFVEVRVDEDLGEVRLARAVSASLPGRF